MKIRTQLLLAFLVLAILPLAASVFYSYSMSRQALRQTFEESARGLTQDMERRLTAVHEALEQRLARFPSLTAEDLPRLQGGPLARDLLRSLGDSARFVDSIDFIPEASEPPEGPDPAPQPSDVAAGQAFVIKIAESLAEAVQAEEQAVEVEVRAIEEALSWAQIGRITETLEALDPEAVATQQDPSSPAFETQTLPPRALEALNAQREEVRRILGREGLEIPIREGEETIGRLRASIRPRLLLRHVLARTRKNQGEIPFAIDSSGEVHTATEEQQSLLAPLDLERGETTEIRSGDWLVVQKEDRQTGLTFGIARPVGAPLARFRRAAWLNLTFGLLLISLAVVGVWLLSERMSRQVRLLTEGAERLAKGALGTQVPVQSGGELGQLAGSFNSMARQLGENQSQLLEAERQRQEEETERRVLRSEVERQTAELEEARRFQLSMLPDRLPDHPTWEMAVHMQTATEVGGDYYDIQEGTDGSLILAVGDATGHGARAGTMVTIAKSLFSAAADWGHPSDFLRHAAQTIRRMHLGRMAMALTLARLAGSRVTITAAGMPPALLYRGSGESQEIALTGMPLGAFAAASYEERTLTLGRGDVLLLMTDGFPELSDGDGEPLGYEAAARIFRSAAKAAATAEDILSSLRAAVSERTGENAPDDDVTFVVLRHR